MVLGKGSKFRDVISNRYDDSLVSKLSGKIGSRENLTLTKCQNCRYWITVTMLSIVVTLALIIGIPLTFIAFIFDVLHAVVYVLVHPERIFEPIAKTSVPPNRAKDIVDVLSAKRRLFHAFSERIPFTLPSCLRLVVLYPYWLLALFLSTCWKCLKEFASSVFKNFTGCCGRKHIHKSDDVKYIFVEFNAWTYSGSDNLWASFMETLWTQVESTFSEHAVRIHRASIALSTNEDDSDDIETRTRKRNEALFRYYVTTILAFLGAVGGVGLGVFLLVYFGKCAVEDGEAAPNCIYAPLADLEANLADDDEGNVIILSESADITRHVFGILAVTISPLPFFKKLHTFIRDVLPALISSKNQVLQGALLGEGYNRKDFSVDTGFMGIVKTEAGHLFDFVRTNTWYDEEKNEYRNVRLCICVDDLDRCNSEITVSVLEAMFLLLSDSPITCYLAIDTRLVVASIDEHRLVHDRAGVNGYDFLEKLVQLEFCIPDLTNTNKQEYLKRLFFEGLLNPLALLGRIYKLQEMGYTEILDCFQSLKDTGDTPQPLPIIAKGMKNARKKGTSGFAFDRLDEFCIYKQDRELENFEDVKDFVPAEKEKFMSIVADYLMHIQKDMRNFADDSIEASDTGETQVRNAGVTSDPWVGRRQSETITIGQSPSSTYHSPYVTGSVSSQDHTFRNEPAGVENQINGELGATTNSLNNENAAVQNQVGAALETMVTEEEQQWFNEFAKYLVVKARSITRVINVYNTARYVSKHTLGNTDAIFRRKLLQMLILVEFWPYRLSWLMQVVEDAGQCDDMKDCMVSTPMNTAAPVLDMDVLLRKIATTSIQQTANEPTNLFHSISLLDIYTKLVKNLIHSPANAKKMLSRDCDPQLFEQLLGDRGPAKNVENQLNMSDLLLPDQCEKLMDGVTTIRPFLFNMPRHMTETASSCLDNLVLFYQEDNGQALVKYKYKKDHFHAQQQSLPSHHNQLSSSSTDNRSNHHSTSNIQDDKISHLEKSLQGKEEEYRKENDEFLKKMYKTKILSLEEEILSVKKDATTEILSGRLEKAVQAKKNEYRNETDEFLKDNCKQEIQSLTARLAALREADFQV